MDVLVDLLVKVKLIEVLLDRFHFLRYWVVLADQVDQAFQIFHVLAHHERIVPGLELFVMNKDIRTPSVVKDLISDPFCILNVSKFIFVSDKHRYWNLSVFNLFEVNLRRRALTIFQVVHCIRSIIKKLKFF